MTQPDQTPVPVDIEPITELGAVRALIQVASEAAAILAATHSEQPPSAHEMAAWARRRAAVLARIAQLWPQLRAEADLAMSDWQQAEQDLIVDELARVRRGEPPTGPEMARRR